MYGSLNCNSSIQTIEIYKNTGCFRVKPKLKQKQKQTITNLANLSITKLGHFHLLYCSNLVVITAHRCLLILFSVIVVQCRHGCILWLDLMQLECKLQWILCEINIINVNAAVFFLRFWSSLKIQCVESEKKNVNVSSYKCFFYFKAAILAAKSCPCLDCFSCHWFLYSENCFFYFSFSLHRMILFWFVNYLFARKRRCFSFIRKYWKQQQNHTYLV